MPQPQQSEPALDVIRLEPMGRFKQTQNGTLHASGGFYLYPLTFTQQQPHYYIIYYVATVCLHHFISPYDSCIVFTRDLSSAYSFNRAQV